MRYFAGHEGFQIHAGAEAAPRAGKDAHAQPLIALQAIDRGGHAFGQRPVDRISGRGPIEGDDQHIALNLGDYLVAGRRLKGRVVVGHFISCISGHFTTCHFACHRVLLFCMAFYTAFYLECRGANLSAQHSRAARRGSAQRGVHWPHWPGKPLLSRR